MSAASAVCQIPHRPDGEEKPPRVRPEHGSIRSNSVELDTKRVKEIEMNKGKG